uniref:Uncharacterized protein n=1 Tax=Pavo cristatus TaxID=9049 RepID=A0A8C9FZ28_PAVCR
GQPSQRSPTECFHAIKEHQGDGVSKSPEKRSSLPRPSSILPPRRAVSGDREREENSLSLTTSLSSSVRRTTRIAGKKKNFLSISFVELLLPLLLAPLLLLQGHHQAILPVHQALQGHPATPEPHTLLEPPNLPYWYPLRKKLP